MQLFDHREYVSMTMEFRCNLRCVHCMIEDTMHRLVPESADRFDELLAQNTEHRRWKGLILTGSEITLRRDLAAHIFLWPFASLLYLYNAIVAAFSRRITWRGITYNLLSPTEAVIISRDSV